MKHIKGFDELNNVLKKLPVRVENRVLQSATMSAGRVVGKHIRANAPKSAKNEQSPASKKYGRLSRNIRVQPLKRVRKFKGVRGAFIFTKDAFWGRFLEFGTRFIAAMPWFRPGIEQSKKPAFNALREAMGRGLLREVNKLTKENRVS